MAHWLVRLCKHRLLDEGDARRLLDKEALARIEARVAASEARHNGEIRVVVEAGLPLSYLRRGASARERAIAMFGKLGVWDTERNNGVLVYLLLAERAIEIVADRGVDRLVDASEWAAIAEGMKGAFQGGNFEAGLLRAVDAVDALLVRHFARLAGSADVNELPDAPVVR
ncbi:MAG: TPM domain-containing protein [Caldimonas sp.]